MRALGTEGLRHRIGHRAVVERTVDLPLAVDRQVARRPDGGRADIDGEDRVLACRFVDEPRQVLRMDRPAGAGRRPA